MIVRFLGTGTSQGVPVISCLCKVCTSKDPHDIRLRSSILVKQDVHNILIDTGPDLRTQLLRANIDSLEAVLLTHEHNDHVIGLDDLRPLIFNRDSPMPLFGIKRVLDEVKSRFSYAFAENPYPGAPKIDLEEITYYNKFSSATFDILPLPVEHGFIDVTAYRIADFCYITDAKSVPQRSSEKMQNLDVLAVNCLRMTNHHSHFNLEEALGFIESVNPKKAYLTHIGHFLGRSCDLVKKLPENVFLAYDGLEIEI